MLGVRLRVEQSNVATQFKCVLFACEVSSEFLDCTMERICTVELDCLEAEEVDFLALVRTQAA
jgi:hypothetical protein